jgi:predicted nucleic acid-binding Zn ribbon protein
MHASIEKHGSRVTCGLAIHNKCADTCGDLLQYSAGRAEAPDGLAAVSRDM